MRICRCFYVCRSYVTLNFKSNKKYAYNIFFILGMKYIRYKWSKRRILVIYLTNCEEMRDVEKRDTDRTKQFQNQAPLHHITRLKSLYAISVPVPVPATLVSRIKNVSSSTRLATLFHIPERLPARKRSEEETTVASAVTSFSRPSC